MRLGRDRWVVPVLGGAFLLDILFGLVKLIGYGEQESVGFISVTVVLLVLVAAVARQGRR